MSRRVVVDSCVRLLRDLRGGGKGGGESSSTLWRASHLRGIHGESGHADNGDWGAWGVLKGGGESSSPPFIVVVLRNDLFVAAVCRLTCCLKSCLLHRSKNLCLSSLSCFCNSFLFGQRHSKFVFFFIFLHLRSLVPHLHPVVQPSISVTLCVCILFDSGLLLGF